jgi:hypothetical protein
MRLMIMKMTMRTTIVDRERPGEAGVRRAGRSRPVIVTPRPCAIRPTIRDVPASRPAPYRPFRNSGRMYSRLVSPAKPSVIHCSRP